MKVYEIVFSPTGGTLKVADVVAKALASDVIQVDLTNAETDFSTVSFCPEDVCIVAVPSYGGRVPATAISRLRQLSGGQASAVLIAVYGNRAYEDTLLELKDTLLAADFRCIAGIAAVAEHSIMRVFAAGRPNETDLEELKIFAAKIQDKIKTGDIAGDLAVPGNAPYRQYSGVPLKPAAGKKCTKCGLCATRCPVGAIPINAPDETDSTKCISCMRCVSICPSKARAVNPLLLAVVTQKMKEACAKDKKNEVWLSL
ncbi:MAG: 4Fe-4S binding protein [Pseudoflavonifractor sp.]